MKKLFLTIAAIIMFISPAFALTIGEVYDQLGTGDYYCSGSSCSRSDEITTTTQLPDITVGEKDNNAVSGAEVCLTGSLMDGPFKDGERCFPAVSLSPNTGGYTIRGGSVTDTNCITTTKTISDPNHSGTGEWEISTSSSTSGGNC